MQNDWEPTNQEIEEVACKFIFANCYNPQFASIVLQAQQEDPMRMQCQVTKT